MKKDFRNKNTPTLQIFFGRWDSVDDVLNEFGLGKEWKKDVRYIYAQYDTAAYDGIAFVIFERDGKLYEVNDSHCSCHGLSNWDPEETTFKALMFRPNVPQEAKNNLKLFYPQIKSITIRI